MYEDPDAPDERFDFADNSDQACSPVSSGRPHKHTVKTGAIAVIPHDILKNEPCFSSHEKQNYTNWALCKHARYVLLSQAFPSKSKLATRAGIHSSLISAAVASALCTQYLINEMASQPVNSHIPTRKLAHLYEEDGWRITLSIYLLHASIIACMVAESPIGIILLLESNIHPHQRVRSLN